MKKKIGIMALLIPSFVFLACDHNDDDEKSIKQNEIDLLYTEFPEAKKEIIETWTAIEQSLREGDIDKLIAFHGYSPKFTEYKNGEVVNGAEANESFERNTFGAVTEVVKFDTVDFKVAVYGDVANVTFQADFHLKFGDNLAVINEQTTLLFVKTTEGWKIVHEHHSPWTP